MFSTKQPTHPLSLPRTISLQNVLGTKINVSEDTDIDIESESEASIIMSVHDSSDEMENFHLEDDV